MKGRKRSSPDEREVDDDSDEEKVESHYDDVRERKVPRPSNDPPPVPKEDDEDDGDEDDDCDVAEGVPSSQVTSLIRMPKYRDILLGRGRGVQACNGNYLMREIAKKHREKYSSLKRDHRRAYSEAVLDEIYGSGARFLKKVETEEGEFWKEVDRSVAHDKVSHALREKHFETVRRRPGLPVGTGSESDTQMFQDPVSGKMYHIANATNLTSAQATGAPTGQGGPASTPSTSAAVVTSAAPVAYPSLAGIDLQNQMLQSLLSPFPVQHTSLGIQGFRTPHGSSMFGVMGGVGALPMGGVSTPNLSSLLSSLASLVQSNPGLGALIQQALGPANNAPSNPDVHRILNLPLTMNFAPTVGNASSTMMNMNNLRDISQAYALSTAAAGAPQGNVLLNQQVPTHTRDANLSLPVRPTSSEIRQERPVLPHHHDSRIGDGVADVLQSAQQPTWGNAGRIDYAPPSAPPLAAGTDYALAVMQALMAVRPSTDSSNGSAPFDGTKPSDNSGSNG